MQKTTKEIIEEALHSGEFIEGITEAFDFFETIKRAYQTENVIVLEVVKNALERRIVELNIKHWFERINTILRC